MSQTPHITSKPDFGANEWLVDEMHDRYLEDPESVDEAWRELFSAQDGSVDGGDGSAPAEPSRKSPSAAADGDTAGPSRGSNGSARPAGAKPAAREEAQTPRTAATPTDKPAPSTAPGPAPKPRTTMPTTSPAAVTGSPATSAAAPEMPKEQPAPRAAKSVPSDRPVPKDPPRRSLDNDGSEEPQHLVLKGAAARTVANMDESLSVPTATSVRTVPVKLLIDNRIVINNHLARARGGKVSFTHIIGYALAKAITAMPEMNTGFEMVDGKPNLVRPAHVNLGLAIDLPKPDGSRQLVVPSIKAAETMGFAEFWGAYEDIVRRARDNRLTVADFQGTSVTLTNPGTIGTNHSVPRLMSGQGAIIGVGAMEYPPEYQGASEETLTRNAISKVMTLTSTYDHRVIQGAQSGEFLRRLHGLLLGEEGFYDEIFRALRIPYEPIRWAADISANHDDEVSKQARILEMI
ncbi:MAG: multifunctional 2-oxoglutarate metabolism enzyme, partial [Nocardioidaceae bacterium]|nr:multifunctional 2-oxoglutarate metabolism enzyme [Nocardioidaceae bacterium]